MLPELFDMDGLVHHKFVPPWQSVAGHFYVQVLQRLCNAVRRKRRYRWQGHDNSPSYTSLVLQQFVAERHILSSPNHHTLWIWLQVIVGCSLPWKWVWRRHILQPWRTTNQMWWLNSWRFQKKPSVCASNNGQCNTPILGTFGLPIIYQIIKLCIVNLVALLFWYFTLYYILVFFTCSHWTLYAWWLFQPGLHYIHLLFCSPSPPPPSLSIYISVYVRVHSHYTSVDILCFISLSWEL
jgi:hypothetical protein